MRITSSWLTEFVAPPPPDQLAEIFEMAGIGVEGHEPDGDDHRWSLEVTSNRGDWLSVAGLAREIHAFTGGLLHPVSGNLDEKGPPLGDRVSVEVYNSADCPRYVARLVEDVQIGESPAWMQQRLIACGMRPINNVVDITNYVMLETGQPLHAFDADKIAAGRILVRRGASYEKLLTLDGVERQLTGEVLVIADCEKPVGIAGVMGGLESEVTTGTRRVILESAHFDPTRVRRGARALGLATEASRRFERWVDPNQVGRCADRACGLLERFAGARVARGAVDFYPHRIENAQVDLRVDRCNQMLGLHLPPGEIEELLRRLRLEIISRDEARLKVSVPTWRRDIARPVDLIEEVARLYGYDKITATLPAGANAAAGLSPAQHLEQDAREICLRCGLQEVVTLSLESPAAVQRAHLPVDPDAVTLRNPLSDDFTCLRTSLLPSMLQVLANNSRHRRPVAVFEFGKAYHRRSGRQPDEERHLAVAMMGAGQSRHWKGGGTTVDFFSLKAVLHRLLVELTSVEPAYVPAERPSLHPGRSASIELAGHEVGFLGEVHPDVAARYDLQQRAQVGLIHWEALLPHLALARGYAPLPRHPSADRDLALVLPHDSAAGEVEAVVRAAGAPLLEYAEVFDVYSGPPLAAGFKSLALSLRFRSPERTLQDEEVDVCVRAVVAAVSEKLGARLRD